MSSSNVMKITEFASQAGEARIAVTYLFNHASPTLTAQSCMSLQRSGVIQVNAANETETSAEGVNDTSSIDKDALGVVHAVFYTQ